MNSIEALVGFSVATMVVFMVLLWDRFIAFPKRKPDILIQSHLSLDTPNAIVRQLDTPPTWVGWAYSVMPLVSMLAVLSAFFYEKLKLTAHFPLLLVAITFVCGILAAIDRFWLQPLRKKTYQTAVRQNPTAKSIPETSQNPRGIMEFARSMFPVFLVVLVLRSFIAEPFQIPSGSMMPTLIEGDFILTSKFAYGVRLPVLDTKVMPVGEPKRGDVLVFRYPSDPSVNFIKRIIGLPGDHVVYTKNKRLIINGDMVPETYLNQAAGKHGEYAHYQEQLGEHLHDIYKKSNANITHMDQSWTVPSGHYFVMGDNRDDSRDSRFWDGDNRPTELQPFVPDDHIIGKAEWIWMTWNRQQSIPFDFSRVGRLD